MGATNGRFWTDQFLRTDGTPYAGVRVFHYVAGNTTTNLDVYQDGTLQAAHNNPVVGDANGRVWFYGNGTYRLLVKTSTADGNLTLYDWDQVELLHHTATLRAEDRALSLPAASSSSRGRLFATTDLSGDVTSLYIQNTAASWKQLLTLPTLSQMLEFAKGSTIASTTNVTIPTDGNFFDVSGTTTIDTFSSFTGYPIIYTRTLSALTFTHGANLLLQGLQNRTTLANQVTAWLHLGAGVWMELFYTTPLLGDATFIDGSVLIGNGTNQLVDLALPTVNRVLGHSGTVAEDPSWLTGLLYHGPTGVGTGSTRTHEGNTIISVPGSLSGIHYYTSFTLNAGITLTVPTSGRRLILIASDFITINGTITSVGAGADGGTSVQTGDGNAGSPGTDQPGSPGQDGGGGVGGEGGSISQFGYTLGTASQTGSGVGLLASPFGAMGGAGGGSGGGGPASNSGTGGSGGGSIILIAPVINLGPGCVLNSSGAPGGAQNGGAAGNGGQGGAGNLYVWCRVYTDNGATFTQSPNGVKQINLYG